MTSESSGGTSTQPVRVRLCFVCLGNICRSPTAAGVMRHLVSEQGYEHALLIESAGTAGYHVGELPDDRARATARARGVDIDDPAWQFSPSDFDRFDLIVAMDHDNVRNIHRLTDSDDHRAKVVLLRDFDPESPPDSPVPDPYYDEEDGFATVFDLVHDACRGLLDELVTSYGLERSEP